MKIKKFMLRFSGFLGVFIWLTALLGCGSTKVNVSECGSIVVFSVTGSMSVPYIEEKDDEYKDMDGLLTKSANAIFSRDNPEIAGARDRVDFCVDELQLLFEETAGLRVVPKETLLESETYKNMSAGILGYLETEVYATGYKMINEIGSKRARILMSEIGADSMISADFKFNKIITEGTELKGRIAAVVTATFNLYDSRGKNVIQDTIEVQSQQTVEIDFLNYDKQALVDLFPELVDQAINTFIVKNM